MKKINWKPIPKMSPGSPHPHQATMDIQDNWIKYEKGHYITRPYWKYASSKWEMSLPETYEVLFHPIKHSPDVVLLELGVYTGESISYFRDFFTHPDAKIVGFDSHSCDHYGMGSGPYSGSTHNVVFCQGDQKDSNAIKKVCETHGPFNVVMDDASHDPQLTEDVFHLVWPFIKEGGFYIVEDLGHDQIAHLLDEVVVDNQGKGFFSDGSYGFGPRAGKGGLWVLLKTKDRITGLDEVLVEDPNDGV